MNEQTNHSVIMKMSQYHSQVIKVKALLLIEFTTHTSICNTFTGIWDSLGVAQCNCLSTYRVTLLQRNAQHWCHPKMVWWNRRLVSVIRWKEMNAVCHATPDLLWRTELITNFWLVRCLVYGQGKYRLVTVMVFIDSAQGIGSWILESLQSCVQCIPRI